MTIVYGIDWQNKVVPLLLTIDGKIQFDPSSLILSGEPLLTDGAGRLIISSAAMPETTFDAIYSNINNTSLPAGTSNQLDTAVPASQAYMWKSITMRYTGTVAGVSLLPSVVRSGAFYAIQVIAPPVSNTFYSFTFDVPMIAGDQAGVRILGATLNDDLLGYLTYRRIR